MTPSTDSLSTRRSKRWPVATAAAKRYAKAVFELAEQDRQVDDWGRRLTSIRESFSDPDVAAVLTNPTIATEQRMVLISGAPHVLDPEATNLAKLLIESNRVRDIGAIAAEFQRLADDAAGRVRATVTTAVELTPKDRHRGEDELSKRLGKENRMHPVLGPALLRRPTPPDGDPLCSPPVFPPSQHLRRPPRASY